MASLRELEARFARAILHDDVASLADLIEPDGLDASDRIQVHHTTIFGSLSDGLMQTFPAICRLVDIRFFAFVADCFIREAPPQSACLDEFGAAFPEFLVAFPPCADLPYLGDVARLEWLLHRAARAPELPRLSAAALTTIAADRYDDLSLHFAPQIAYLESKYPASRIWEANATAEPVGVIIDWTAHGERLELSCHAGVPTVRSLAPADFAFRSRLAAGDRLITAAEAALAIAPLFDLIRALVELFGDGCVVGCALVPPAS